MAKTILSQLIIIIIQNFTPREPYVMVNTSHDAFLSPIFGLCKLDFRFLKDDVSLQLEPQTKLYNTKRTVNLQPVYVLKRVFRKKLVLNLLTIWDKQSKHNFLTTQTYYKF